MTADDPPAWRVGALLGLALAWIVLVRIPLVLNAPVHLDSDLAVDGLTLIDALHGRWRWHYPGTPHIGSAALGLSFLQAALFGATPETLVSGGVLAYVLLVLATFWMAREIAGTAVALWTLIPLCFASTGLVWLSGRITGGHLLIAAWHAAAFALLARLLARGGAGRAAALGIFCGLGLWVDRLFLFSLLGIIPALLLRIPDPTAWQRRLVETVIFGLGVLLGHLPAPLGQRLDPYDAYGSQFETILVDPARRRFDWSSAQRLAWDHAQILATQCVPRLFSGQRLVWDRAGRFRGLASDPTPELFGGRPQRRDRIDNGPIPWSALAIGITAAVLALIGLIRPLHPASNPILLAQGALLTAGALTLAGFILNRHIYDSDNYRYLVTWIPTWAFGLASTLERGTRQSGRRWIATGFAAIFALVMTLDTARWYRQLGWLDGVRPVRVPLNDRAFQWLSQHPEVDAIYGGYWDVYRLAFLRGGTLKAVPFPEYPVRFPEWRDQFPGDRPPILIARPDRLGSFNRAKALSEGARILDESPDLAILDWPNR
ncbi:MAG: hypothetical protein KatS3mg108_2754 [Isosphaeraceae bacterium]|jgi:hypothetical protein|nr:MAG: hypothetical protein KatS3mg108_2754 [Isosphaeraceae bacterium]